MNGGDGNKKEKLEGNYEEGEDEDEKEEKNNV